MYPLLKPLRLSLIVALALAPALLLASCQKPKSPYTTALPTREVMRFVIDPAAVELWKNAGEVDDAQGAHFLAPTTDEGWQRAEAMAATVAESSNVLLLPGRVRHINKKDDAWTGFVQNLAQNALAAKAAAKAHDSKKMFDTGASLYQACVDCHQKYLLPFLNKDGSQKDAPGASGATAPSI